MKSKKLGVIVYLSQNTPYRKRSLKKSLNLLFSSFNKRFRYPVIVFHEGDFKENDIKLIRSVIPSCCFDILTFKEIDKDDFVTPTNIIKDIVDVSKILMSNPRDLGYRNMCRWWIGRLDKYIHDYEYYMRIDDDLYLDGAIEFDPFQLVLRKKLDYVSSMIHIEHPLNSLGLYDFSKEIFDGSPDVESLFIESVSNSIDIEKILEFTRKIPIGLQQYMSIERIKCPIMYYNNFHIARTKLWKNPVIKKFFDAVEESTGIYHLRWGDAPLQTIAVVACPNLRIGRLPLKYTKRHERKWGPFVNTDHQAAKRYFEESRGGIEFATGSMTDFSKFRELLFNLQLDYLYQPINPLRSLP